MFNRRQFIRTTGLAGALALAGCTTRASPTGGTKLPTEPNYGGWFEGVSNYEGTHDRRGRASVTIDVGAQGNMGYYKFSPAAVAVSPGTAVTWRWTGKGGAHDVKAENGAFASPTTDGAGSTFSFTFEKPGVFKYYCTPHRSMGMKGAVFVALED